MADRQLELGLDAPPRRARTAALRSAHYRSHVTAEEAVAGDAKAAGQEAEVLAWFRARPERHATPSDVWMALGGMARGWPLTSIRRAMTNLANDRPGRDHQLVHHPEDRRDGPFGAKESTWSLAPSGEKEIS